MFSLIPYRAYRNSGVKTSTFLRGGFTLVEITVAVLIMAILAAITIPVLSRIRMVANEAAAAKTIRTLTTAMENWRFANGSYYGANLTVLANSSPPYIDKILGCSNPKAGCTVVCPKQGYNFTVRTRPNCWAGGNNYRYLIGASPLIPNQTGRRYFCAVEDGVIKYTNNNSNLLNSYDMCKTWALTYAEILE